MTERAADVPPGPYFHGTRREIPIGAELATGTVDPAFGDHRQMAWAYTDEAQALKRARSTSSSYGSTLYVYEVELDDPEVDTNVHRPGYTGPVTSVMAPSGRVIRLAISKIE